MPDIITILYILFAFCTIVALAGVVFAIRLRIKSESFENTKEREASTEAMGLSKIDTLTTSNMKRKDLTYENLPLMINPQYYYMEDPLIEKKSDLGILEFLDSAKLYESPRRPAGMRDIGEEKLDEKVKKPGEKIRESIIFKESYKGKTYRNRKKRRRKRLESTISGIY